MLRIIYYAAFDIKTPIKEKSVFVQNCCIKKFMSLMAGKELDERNIFDGI